MPLPAARSTRVETQPGPFCKLSARKPSVMKASLRAGFFLWCAEHAQQLGGASPLPNLMVVKGQ
jgi:hypothetical protein